MSAIILVNNVLVMFRYR